MDANNETLGKFKIEIAVDGKTQVTNDLEAMRTGLRNLQNEFKQSVREGEKLADVLTGIRRGKRGGGNAGRGLSYGSMSLRTGIFDEMLKAAHKSTSAISIFADAVKKASQELVKNTLRAHTKAVNRDTNAFGQHTPTVRDDTGAIRTHTKSVKGDTTALGKHSPIVRDDTSAFRTHTKSVKGDTTAFGQHTPIVRDDTRALRTHTGSMHRLNQATNQVIGEEIHDAHGVGTGRYSGLRGFNQELRGANTSFNKTRRTSDLLYATFQRLIGENRVTRDPITGKVTDVQRSGTKKLIHSLDALSKAALGAAKNLKKIGILKGGGADGGVGGGGGQSAFDKILKSMKGREKTLTGIGKILQHGNIGNVAALNKIASVFGTLGRLVGMLGSGALGVGAAVVGIAAKVVDINLSRAKEGKGVAFEKYKYKKRLDSMGLNANKIANTAQDYKYAYRVLDENNRVDAVNTDIAANEAQYKKASTFATDWALFRTRGTITPWMEAMAMQGVDFTKITNQEDMMKVLEAKYKTAKEKGEGSMAMAQWRTLIHEMGNMVSNEDLEAITYAGEKNEKGEYKYAPGIEGFKAKTKATIGEKSGFDEEHLKQAQLVDAHVSEQGNARDTWNTQIERNNELMLSATGWLAITSDNVKNISSHVATIAGRGFNVLFGSNTDYTDKQKEDQEKVRGNQIAVAEYNRQKYINAQKEATKINSLPIAERYKLAYEKPSTQAVDSVDNTTISVQQKMESVDETTESLPINPIDSINKTTQTLDAPANSAYDNLNATKKNSVEVKIDLHGNFTDEIQSKLESPVFSTMLQEYLEGSTIRP